MEDLDAASQIVKKRTDAYALPEHMKEWFGPSKLEDLKTQFGIFDDSGDGNISAQELRAVLRSLGTELSHEQVVEIIDMIDADKSGEIEFPEFVSLMRKIEKGEIDIGDSALTQAIMSRYAKRKRGAGTRCRRGSTGVAAAANPQLPAASRRCASRTR
jgi:hypothetical protein